MAGTFGKPTPFEQAMVLRHLALAERHVARAKEHVEAQRDRVAKLLEGGHDTSQARHLLATFETTLVSHQDDLERLRRERDLTQAPD